MLAFNASTLPRGHFLVESYLFNVAESGNKSPGSLAYMEYGLIDRLTVGAIPIIEYSLPEHGPSSSGIQVGDFSLLAQYRLSQFREGHRIPTASVLVQQGFPSGPYDRLNTRPGNGTGSGTYLTSLSLNTQSYLWLPNGRILRWRFDTTGSISSRAAVTDASVYGTGAGFSGHAQPGKTINFDLSGEYSITRHWVVALDGVYKYSASTVVTGTQNGAPYLSNSGTSWIYGFAPALEYNFSSRVGLLLGTRILTPGNNAALAVTPAIAINYVH